MNRKRLEKIEQKLDMGKPRVGYTFRVKGNNGKITEHSKEVKGYKGQPQVVECEEEDWNL